MIIKMLWFQRDFPLNPGETVSKLAVQHSKTYLVDVYGGFTEADCFLQLPGKHDENPASSSEGGTVGWILLIRQTNSWFIGVCSE